VAPKRPEARDEAKRAGPVGLGPVLPMSILKAAANGYNGPVRYLAVSNTPQRALRVTLRPKAHGHPQWHAVAAANLKPIRTLCGMWCMSEAHRTWDQTPLATRCPLCQQLVERAAPR